jgi:hypothetical protein
MLKYSRSSRAKTRLSISWKICRSRLRLATMITAARIRIRPELNDKIKHLEMANDQKSAEIGRLSLKVAEQELKIKEEANKASALLLKCSQYVEEITSLKSKILSLEYT